MKTIIKSDDVSIFGAQEIKKASTQTNDENAAQWLEPRLPFSTLAKFYDWNSWHRRCILIKAGMTVGLGWELVTDDEDKEPDDEHRRVSAWLKSCNEAGQSFTRIAYRTAVDYYHLGNGFTEIAHNRKGELAEVYHAPAISMRVGRNQESYWQLRHGKQVQFASLKKPVEGKNTVAHLAAYDAMDDYYGMPEWLPAMATMVLDRNAVSYNTYNFENEFLAKVLLFVRGAKLDKDVKNKLKGFFSGQYKGVENAGKAVVIDVDDPNIDIKVEKLQLEQKDMAFLRSREYNRNEVVEMHNVPPRILCIMQAGQLGGTGEISGQLKIFRDITLAPAKTEMEEYWNSTLIPGLGMSKWRLEFKLFDITTALEDAEYLSKVQPYVNDDEARQVLGLKPREMPTAAQPQNGNAGDLVKSLVVLRKSLQQEIESC